MPLVQSTPLVSSIWGPPPELTFPAPVTPGNVIIVMGARADWGIPLVITSDRGDVFESAETLTSGGTFPIFAHAIAVGGDTTITLPDEGFVRVVAQEWSGITFDAAAGVGVQADHEDIAVSTPNSTSTPNSVVFTVWSVFTGETYGDEQQAPAGFTEFARYTEGSDVPFIAGCREDTVAGVKTALWIDHPVYVDGQSTVIVAFSVDGGEPQIRKLATRVGGAWVEGVLKTRVGDVWVEGALKARVGGEWV